MKIVFLVGQSGVGKTVIGKELSEMSDKYNFVHSYTDRIMRDAEEWGHTFVDSAYMDLLLERSDIVAKTIIKESRYCAIRSQFDDNKVNIYITDVNGINDTLKSFPTAEIMVVLINRSIINSDVTFERSSRDVLVPPREDVDFLIHNDGSVESAAVTINVLVNSDFFKKPAHTTSTIEDSLERVYEQRRYLDKIEESLEEQRWYRDKPLYNQLIEYVKEQINTEYNVEIYPDDEPIWDGNDCVYRVMAWYEESEDHIIDGMRLNELLSKYVHDFCSMNDCMQLVLRTYINSDWVGAKDEY